MADSDGYTIGGDGSGGNPFNVNSIIDPAANNMFDETAAGLGAFLPPEIEDPPTCSVYRSAVQTIATSTQTIILFNQEMFDTDSQHDSVTNNDRITFNTAGVYSMSAHVRWQGNANGDRKIEIWMNNLTIIASTEDSVDQSDDFSQMVARAAWKVTAGEYANVQVSQNSGSSLQILLNPEFSPHFCTARVAVG